MEKIIGPIIFLWA